MGSGARKAQRAGGGDHVAKFGADARGGQIQGVGVVVQRVAVAAGGLSRLD